MISPAIRQIEYLICYTRMLLNMEGYSVALLDTLLGFMCCDSDGN